METCKIAICFDDGRKDLIDVALPLLQKYSLKCTCYLTTGYIDGSAGKCPSVLPAISISDVQAISLLDGVEIGCHGHLHKNDVDDILAGLRTLTEWIGPNFIEKGVGFASPGTALIRNPDTERQLEDAGIHYIRLSLRIRTWNFFRNIARKICRVWSIPFLYQFSYAETFVSKQESPYIYSVPIYRTDTSNMLLSLVKCAIKERKNVVFMFHSVMEHIPEEVPGVERNWIYPVSDFETFCKELAHFRDSGQCQINTVEEIYRLS